MSALGFQNLLLRFNEKPRNGGGFGAEDFPRPLRQGIPTKPPKKRAIRENIRFLMPPPGETFPREAGLFNIGNNPALFSMYHLYTPDTWSVYRISRGITWKDKLVGVPCLIVQYYRSNVPVIPDEIIVRTTNQVENH